MTDNFSRLPRRVRHTLYLAGIHTLADLLAADRAALDLSPTDAARVEYLVNRALPPPPAPVIEEQPPAQATPAAADPGADLPPLLTTTQAAAFLQLSRRTVATMCADGRIAAAWKLGDDWRIPRAALLALLHIPEEQP